MDMITLSIICFVLLTIVFILIGIKFQKMVTNTDDYLLAGRSAPFWLMSAAYLGSLLGGGTATGYMSNGYTSGIAQSWLMLLAYLGLTCFTLFFSRKLNYFGRKHGAITQADFVCKRFGEKLRLPIAIIGLIRPIFMTGVQILTLAIVINIAFGWSLTVSAIVSAASMALYMVTAGQYSAMITQWLQAILQSAGMLLFAIFVIKLIGTPQAAADAIYNVLEPTFTDPTNIDFSLLTTWILTFFLCYMVDPWMFMWAYAGKDPKTASNAQFSILSCSYFGNLPYMAGLALAAAVTIGVIALPDGLTADQLYAWFTVNHTPIAVGAIILVGLIMTVISCGASVTMTGVGIVTKDLYKSVINKNATDKQALTVSRVALIAILVCAVICALWVPVLMPLWTLAQALVIAGLLVPVFAAWFSKGVTSAAARWSSITGVLGCAAWAIYAWITTGSAGNIVFGLHASHIGVGLSLIVVIIVTLVTKHSEDEDFESTNFFLLSKEMTSTDADMNNPAIGNVIFRWLGAKSTVSKVGWIVTFILFALHYVLVAGFSFEACGLTLIWLALVACTIYPLILTVLGGRDIRDMISLSAELAEAEREKNK